MKAVGIILAGGYNKKMGILSQKRAVPAMPVAGSYRGIDFALSSMTNSQIEKVAVITQYNAHSLSDHLSSSKWWNFGRKQGGLIVYTPSITPTNANWYRGTADSMYQNIKFLKDSHDPYVIIAGGDSVYKLNFNDVLDYHITKGADITMVCKEMPMSNDLTRFGLVKVDEDNRVTELEEKPIVPTSTLVSCGIYVIRRRQLIEILEQCADEDRYDFVRDVLMRYTSIKKIYAYNMPGYWSCINSLDSYYKTNMDFLKHEVSDYFFNQHPDIYSKPDDNPPAKYNPGCHTINSLISSGCIINGTVDSSILFKQVYVGNGCTIRNSIVLDDVYIGDNTVIENCIVESHDTIKPNMTYIGEPDNIRVVVEKNLRYNFQ